MSDGGWGGVCLSGCIYCIHLYYTLSTGANSGLCLSVHRGMGMSGNGFQAWGIKWPGTFFIESSMQ